ncbi:MAG: lipoprotein, partial [Prevotella sp.]|nr:lipoprotein [Prevotella sp.]
MKKIIFIIGAILLFTGCDSFLDSESYTKKNTGNFPKTLDDANKMITAIYST